MTVYPHQIIQNKWQKNWEDQKPYRALDQCDKPKYYVLDMFPYPSGAGLHVGHIVGYTASDIIARYKRQNGFNVLHPMGWDSFGLPAEQYAVRTGTHPEVTTRKNIDTYRRQLKSLGFSYDWEREVATTDPKYYKWTQWIFTQLFEKGLAYEADMLVNWCPALGTVLANEEVDEGRAKEGGHLVERKPLRQWVLKITAYAERLLEDLDLLDWPEGLKKLQRNWIGKSTGVTVDFIEEKTKEKLTIFTTCPHTLFGATFMVLAPEHPLLDCITSTEQKEAVKAYQKKVSKESDLYRTELATDKTGVFTGAFATNPVNGESIPIWIADYVLMGYGTGAVMAVPAHDERDFEFAKKFKIPIKPVIDPDFKTTEESFADPEQVRRQVLEGNYCWPFGGKHIDSGLIDGLPIEQAKEKIADWLEELGSGKRTITYKLRDWLFSRQRYWGEPFPVLHLADGTTRALKVDELPLMPPQISDYRPTGDGLSPLAKVEEWVNVTDSVTGESVQRETNTMPQWAGSCWYYLRFMDPHNDEKAWDKKKEAYWGPVDLYIGGAEHAVLHLLYARFWHKVLYDCNYVSTKEPFQRLFNQGLMVSRSYQLPNGVYVSPEEVEERDEKYFHNETGQELRSQIDKMSKSKLNGVTPDEVVEEFGADALRLYEMFMGPLDKERVWNMAAVNGCRRFLNRFWEMSTSDKIVDEQNEISLRLGLRLVKGVTDDLESLQLNTAIAKMMEFINAFTKLPSYPKETLKWALQCLYSFAPHICCELWERLGFSENIHTLNFPEVNPKYLVDAVVTYVVQVNGKMRGRFDLPKDEDKECILECALKNPSIKKHVHGKEIKKTIFIPNKLINLVV